VNQPSKQLDECRPSKVHASRKKLLRVDDPLLTEADVLDATTLGRTRFRELLRAGEFPAPRQVSTCRVAWTCRSVQSWIDQRPIADAYKDVNHSADDSSVAAA